MNNLWLETIKCKLEQPTNLEEVEEVALSNVCEHWR